MRLQVLLRIVVWLSVLVLAAAAGGAAAPPQGHDRLVVVARGLSDPVDVVAAPGQPGRLYVVERFGQVVLVQNGKASGTFLDLRSIVYTDGSDEQGLLSIAFSPGYQTNHRFYVAYTVRSGDLHVVEYSSRAGAADPASAQLLLVVPHSSYSNHNGGDLQFDKQGLLYLGTGDGGSEGDPDNTAQNLNSQLGKLFRISPLKANARWQMVAYGLRNPWRYSFDSKTGDLWIGDVGQDKWEEIDYRPASQIGTLANYGWSVYEGDNSYKPSEPLTNAGILVKPIYVYSHAHGCAIIGGYVYRGRRIPADQGKYYFGDYCSGAIWMLTRAGANTHVTKEPFTVPQLSAFGQDVTGNLYATSLTGTLYEITR